MSYDGYVKLVTLTAGFSAQQDTVKEKLVLGEMYPITSIEIGGWCSYVTIPDKGDFNSVFFEFYDKDKNLLEDDVFSDELSGITTHDY